MTVAELRKALEGLPDDLRVATMAMDRYGFAGSSADVIVEHVPVGYGGMQGDYAPCVFICGEFERSPG